MKNLFFLIAVTSVVYISCKKSTVDQASVIQVNKNSLTFTANAGIDSFVLEGDGRWSIEGFPDWIAVTPKTGNGKAMVYVACSGNTTLEKRHGVLSIYQNNALSQVLDITQEQLFIAIDDMYYTAPGGARFIISGMGFSPRTGGNTVKINGAVVDVMASSEHHIEVMIPMGLGSGPIEVQSGGHTAVAAHDFNYRWVGTVTTYAGAEEGHVDGNLNDARFRGPAGLHFDKEGNLLVAEYGNNHIRKISTSGIVTTLPGRIAHYTNPNGPLNAFDLPQDVTTDQIGNVYVAETNANRITKIATNGTVTVLAGGPLYGSADGTGDQAQFYHPTGIVADADNNLYVADFENSRIRKITPGGVVTTLAGNTTASYADGVGAAALFHGPHSIRFNASGDLIVSDYFNNRIRKSTVEGAVTTIAGNGGIGTLDGLGIEAPIDSPTALATDALGHIFVNEGGRLRRIEPDGHVSTIETPSLGHIQGIAVDANGAIYVSGYISNTIMKVTYQ